MIREQTGNSESGQLEKNGSDTGIGLVEAGMVRQRVWFRNPTLCGVGGQSPATADRTQKHEGRETNSSKGVLQERTDEDPKRRGGKRVGATSTCTWKASL